MAANGDSDDERDEFREDRAAKRQEAFRYEVIEILVEREDYAPGELSQLVKDLSKRTFYWPGRGPMRVSERTIYAWLRRYREGGVKALRPKRRKDWGTMKALDEPLLQRAIRLRKEQPKRFTSTLIDIMEKEEPARALTMPHRATLDRHLWERGASRRQLKTLGEKRTITMHFPRFGMLWVGDYKQGPLVRLPDGRVGHSKIGAFIDHCTRYPVAHRFYGDEQLASLRDTLMRAFLLFGIADKIYVDRGAVYRSHELAYSLARVKAKLIFSRAYYSQGRGVIERWWQLVDAFKAEVELLDELPTLHQLNRLWEAFCELRYCDVVHSALGMSPNEAIADVVRKPLAMDIARELFLCDADRTVDRRDACVLVHGTRYLCEAYLRRERVKVIYDPNDRSSVVIYLKGKRIQRAFPKPLNATPEPHPTPEVVPPSVDYLALLRGDYDKRLLERTRAVAYADIKPDDSFDCERFITVVRDLAGLRLSAAERRELSDFYNTHAPLSEDLVRIATEQAVRLHTRGRHVRAYLNAIRVLHIAHLKSDPQKGHTNTP